MRLRDFPAVLYRCAVAFAVWTLETLKGRVK